MILVNSERTVCRIDLPLLSAQRHSNSGTVVLILMKSFGFRLDNRSELLAILDLAPSCEDDDILKAAWSAWREEMPTKLRGSFAFCLIDQEEDCVFIVRDPLGLAPIYYFCSSQYLVIGSSSKLVRSMVPCALAQNELMLADFVAGAVIEKCQTFFDGIFRLPPGSTRKFTQSSSEAKEYWSLGRVTFDHPLNQEPQVFRELFDRSVDNCFVSGSTVLMLSGGLDSSSIAGSLSSKGKRGHKIPCLSRTYSDTKGWTDSEYLEDMYRFLPLEKTTVPSDDHNPLDDLDFWLDALDGPYISPGHSVSFQLRKMAKSMGYSVVLCGEGGDEVVSHGFGRLNELARSGNWISLWRESSASAGMAHTSKFRVFRPYLVHMPLYRLLRRLKAKVARSEQPASTVPDFSDRRYLSSSFQNKIDRARYSRNFSNTARDHDDRQLQIEALSSALLPSVLETHAVCSEACGVETRMPFYSQELIEFSVSLPSHWKLRHGVSRYILRKAMEGDLPASVLSRKDKFNFAGNFIRGLIQHPRRLLELSDPAVNDIGHYANVDLVNEIRQRIANKPDELSWKEALFIWRVAVLSLWLSICKRELTPPDDLIEID